MTWRSRGARQKRRAPQLYVMPMNDSYPLRSVLPILFSGLLPLFFSTVQANSLEIAKLPYEKCVDVSPQNDQAEENQRYWFSRIPSYVWYSKGEKTTAGGDGTCYLGFPSATKKSALVLVNSTIIEVFPIAISNKKVSKYRSSDHSTIVEVRISGGDSTCEPDAEKCCGDYTYATISVKKNGVTKSVKAANYTGG